MTSISHTSPIHFVYLFSISKRDRSPCEKAAPSVAPQRVVAEAQVQHGADGHAALEIVLQEALHRQVAAGRVAWRLNRPEAGSKGPADVEKGLEIHGFQWISMVFSGFSLHFRMRMGRRRASWFT